MGRRVLETLTSHPVRHLLFNCGWRDSRRFHSFVGKKDAVEDQRTTFYVVHSVWFVSAFLALCWHSIGPTVHIPALPTCGGVILQTMSACKC